MNDLIRALTILAGYDDNPSCPTKCEHDELMVMVDPRRVSVEDVALLASLSFRPHEKLPCFVSYRFGGA